ncbi:hypothetical protein K8I61_11865 [bacterium]|nr:hypothetical protein [bacterium]
MKPKKARVSLPLFQTDLIRSIDKKHSLYDLAHNLGLPAFEPAFGDCYATEDNDIRAGRARRPRARNAMKQIDATSAKQRETLRRNDPARH